MKRVIKPSDFINGNFIREVDPIIKNESGYKTRAVELQCMNCNKKFIRPLHNALRIQQKCCSIACSFRLKEKFEGGNERHWLYPRWLSMTQRCLNNNSSNYKNYGARGISIDNSLKSFSSYVEYVTSLPNCPKIPTKDIQLDRIDNSLGYEKGNLRWVDRSVQLSNQRKRINSKYSKYVGISYSIIHNKWVVRLTYKGKTYCSSTHITEEDAVIARNRAITLYNLPHLIQEIKPCND